MTLAASLPAGVGLGTVTTSQGACAPSAGGVTCELGTLPVGASATVQILVSPSAPGSLTLHATASSAAPDVTPANNAATLTTTVNVGTLTVSKVGTGSGTVTSTPAGIDCGADCAESYATATTVTLTAAPVGSGAAASTFAGWSGACSGTGPCQVTVVGPKIVTARFERVNVGVQVGPLPGLTPSGDRRLEVRLTARGGCGPIQSIQFGDADRPFDNARVTITAPAGGPADRTAGFAYAPPTGTTSVTLTLQRVTPSGAATVSPIRLSDGCGDWQTFVGGGPGAFR